MFSTLSLQTSARPAACVSAPRNSRFQRHAALRVVAIGEVNDPEKVKANKEKKKSEGVWAEPKNKNPLEKKTLVHGEADEAADEAKDVVKDIGDGVKGAIDNVKDKVQGK